MKRGNCTADNIYCTFKRVSHSTINIKMQIKFKRNSLVCIRWRNKETSQESNVLSNIFKPIFNVISFPCKFCMYFKRNNDPQKRGGHIKVKKNQFIKEFLYRPLVSSSKHACDILIHFSYELNFCSSRCQT